MKRDWSLIRDILIRIEELPAGAEGIRGMVVIEGYSDDSHTLQEHFILLREAGLVTYGQMTPWGSPFMTRLTWEGHEFLDKIRNDTVWKKTKEAAKTKGLDLTFDIIGQLAGGFMKSTLGLS